MCVLNECVCYPGYGGENCDKLQCEVPDCSGHGRCQPSTSSTKPTCFCAPGWKGVGCQFRICPLGPKGYECSHNGQCQNGTCSCSAGWMGADCSQQTCAQPCLNTQVCQNLTCVCKPGYGGADCGTKLCSSKCVHGSCLNGKCLCDDGWTGAACDQPTCPRACDVHGTCVGMRCECDPGWSGVSCHQLACPRDCHFEDGQGDCIFDKCECYPGFSGPDCGLKGGNSFLHPCGEPCADRCRANEACDREVRTYLLFAKDNKGKRLLNTTITALAAVPPRPNVPIGNSTPGTVLLQTQSRSKLRVRSKTKFTQDRKCFDQCVLACTAKCFAAMHTMDAADRKKVQEQPGFGGITGDMGMPNSTLVDGKELLKVLRSRSKSLDKGISVGNGANVTATSTAAKFTTGTAVMVSGV